MNQTHIIVKPNDLVPVWEHGAELVTDWMHGHGMPGSDANPIASAVWERPSKSQRRLYSGAMERISA
jgi:hypothetical protein